MRKSLRDVVGIVGTAAAHAAIAAAALGAVACGERFQAPTTPSAITATASETPAAPAEAHRYDRSPTLLEHPSAAALDAPGIDRRFYGALVFNEHDGRSRRYGSGVLEESRVREDPAGVGIMLDLTETTGACGMREHTITAARGGGEVSYRHWIAQDTGPIIEHATGEPWRARLHIAESPPEAEAVTGQPNWIVVRLEHRPGCNTVGGGQRDSANRGRRCYGAGTYVGGAWSGQSDMTIYLDRYCRSAFRGAREFRHVWLHDAMGHGMGFWHVPGPTDAMGSGQWNRARFTPREATHMREAYRRGRGAPRSAPRDERYGVARQPSSFTRPVLIEH